jgi:hypothetical protein
MKQFSLIGFSLASLLAIASFAAEPPTAVTMIAFGEDGATGQVSPNENSAKQAFAVYTALDVRPSRTGTKVIDGGDFGIESQDTGLSIAVPETTHKVTKVIKGKVNTILMPMNRGDVSFEGPAAKELFDALKVGGPSAPTKRVANLTCGKTTASYKCIVRDVQFITLEIPN